MDELRIELDLDIQKWPLLDKMDFEDKVGMTAERAGQLMARAAADDTDSEEVRAKAADAAADIPAKVLVGFVWIAARRQRGGLTFEDAAASFSTDDFLEAIPEPVPLAPENRAQRRSTAKSKGRSATTSTTRPSKSEE